MEKPKAALHRAVTAPLVVSMGRTRDEHVQEFRDGAGPIVDDAIAADGIEVGANDDGPGSLGGGNAADDVGLLGAFDRLFPNVGTTATKFVEERFQPGEPDGVIGVREAQALLQDVPVDDVVLDGFGGRKSSEGEGKSESEVDAHERTS